MSLSKDGLTGTNTYYSLDESKRPGQPATSISSENILFTTISVISGASLIALGRKRKTIFKSN